MVFATGGAEAGEAAGLALSFAPPVEAQAMVFGWSPTCSSVVVGSDHGDFLWRGGDGGEWHLDVGDVGLAD